LAVLAALTLEGRSEERLLSRSHRARAGKPGEVREPYSERLARNQSRHRSRAHAQGDSRTTGQRWRSNQLSPFHALRPSIARQIGEGARKLSKGRTEHDRTGRSGKSY